MEDEEKPSLIVQPGNYDTFGGSKASVFLQNENRSGKVRWEGTTGGTKYTAWNNDGKASGGNAELDLRLETWSAPEQGRGHGPER